jgi:hypothetical protein
LGSKNAQVFDACPYCLTEIVIGATSLVTEDEQKPEIKTIEIQEPDKPMMKEKPVQSTATPHCSHQLGYLSKRSPKEKIPEECMMCNSIVQCMLKKLTG